VANAFGVIVRTMDIKISEALSVGFRFLRSFVVKPWTLRDYPIRITRQNIDAVPSAKYKPLPWTVVIVNWWHMRGDGDTAEEAWAHLEENFQARAQQAKPLPRPGTGEEATIEFAETTLVDRYCSIAVEFMPRVLGFERDECFISDESSLDDFPEPNAEYLRKIGIFYGIHPDELENSRLVTIFKRIAERHLGE
jgi:hypothetical protein